MRPPVYINDPYKVLDVIHKSYTPISAKGISLELKREGTMITPSNVCSVLTKLHRRLPDVLIRRKIIDVYHYQFTPNGKNIPVEEIYYDLYLKRPYDFTPEDEQITDQEDLQREPDKLEEYSTDPEKSSTDININLNIKGKIDIVFSFEKIIDK